MELPSGLILQNDFIDEESQKVLVEYIDSQCWNKELKRHTQHYGYKYNYSGGPLVTTTPMSGPVKFIGDFLEKNKILKCEQCIINKYDRTDYINAHSDDLKFGETIVSISLLSPTKMIFSNRNEKIPVILKPLSILVMKGESRYNWKHEIKGTTSFIMDGKKYVKPNDYRRISLTYRNLA